MNVKCLPAWSEYVGTFLRLELFELEVSIVMLCGTEHVMLSFPKGSKEAEAILEKLGQCSSGTKIAVLRSDIPEKPLLIRLIGKIPGE